MSIYGEDHINHPEYVPELGTILVVKFNIQSLFMDAPFVKVTRVKKGVKSFGVTPIGADFKWVDLPFEIGGEVSTSKHRQIFPEKEPGSGQAQPKEFTEEYTVKYSSAANTMAWEIHFTRNGKKCCRLEFEEYDPEKQYFYR